MPLDPVPEGSVLWATELTNNSPLGGVNRIEPSEIRQQVGWLWGDKPDYETLNGWMYNVGQLLEWAKDGLNGLDGDLGDIDFTFSVDENNVGTVAYPAGSCLASTDTETGAFVIVLPNSWTNTRLRFFIDIFEEDSGSSSTLLVSGLNIASAWTDGQASRVSGNKEHRVRFGHDGDNCVVVVGSVGDSWSKPHIRVRSLTTHGGSSWQVVNWVSGWSTSIETDLSGITFSSNDVSVSLTTTLAPAFISDVQTYNTDGQSAPTAGHRTRVLNTTSDPSSIVTSVASNQFILPAGTYDIEVNAVHHRTDRSFCYLYNVSDSAIPFQSNSVFVNDGADSSTDVTFSGRVTLAGSKTFEVRSYTSNGDGVGTFGKAHNVSGYNNIYTKVKITKVG